MKKTLFADCFGAAWIAAFATITVIGLPFASVIYLPLALILIPYYLTARRYQAPEPSSWVAFAYWSVVVLMTAIIVELLRLWYGHV